MVSGRRAWSPKIEGGVKERRDEWDQDALCEIHKESIIRLF